MDERRKGARRKGERRKNMESSKTYLGMQRRLSDRRVGQRRRS